MTIDKDVVEYFTCECTSSDHMVIVGVYTYTDDNPEFYMQVTADNFLPFYKRVWVAIKYIFRQPSLKWHDVLLSNKDVYRLQNCINVYTAESIDSNNEQ